MADIPMQVQQLNLSMVDESPYQTKFVAKDAAGEVKDLTGFDSAAIQIRGSFITAFGGPAPSVVSADATGITLLWTRASVRILLEAKLLNRNQQISYELTLTDGANSGVSHRGNINMLDPGTFIALATIDT